VLDEEAARDALLLDRGELGVGDAAAVSRGLNAVAGSPV